MIILRDYQEKLINETRFNLRTHKSVLMQSPTGSGKTITATSMIQTAISKGKRVFFICHRQELIDQTAKTFGKFGLKFGIIWASAPKLYDQNLQICSIDTLKNRLEEIEPPDLIIWDECHHIAAAGWARVKEHYKNAYHIGLSATPCRLDGKGLGDHFGAMVQGLQTAELMKMGALSGYSFFAPSTPDVSTVKQRMGDFVKAETADLMDCSKIHGDIVKHWFKYARDKRTVVFAVTVNHSKHIAEAFRQAGVMAIHLDGETPKGERKAAAKAFANGDITLICNVGLFGEGYDLAAQAGFDVTVDCIIDAQPTNSLGWCLQKWGRALRPKTDGSKAIILDHAGNWTRHYFPDDFREWSLDGAAKKKKSDEEKTELIRQCGECFHIHRPAPFCPNCGHEYEIKAREMETIEADLEEFDIDAMRREQRQAQGQAESAEDLISGLGYSSGRANHIVQARKEKDRLRKTVLNLLEGAKVADISDYNYSKNEVLKMKPKQLGAIIEELTAKMGGENDLLRKMGVL